MLNKNTEIDRADNRSKRNATARRIKLPGRSTVFANTSPHDIARELRDKSKLGEMERKLADS